MRPRPVLTSLLAYAALATPALAHPHVWITSKAEIMYQADKVAGVHHAWTFDAAYSAFVTQGLDKNGDGKLDSAELAGLAKENTASLAAFGYFTLLKANGLKQELGEPREPTMTFEAGQVTLSFHLPLRTPALANKIVMLEVYDPSFFVSFSIAEGEDAVRLAGAPKGCSLTVTRPKPIDPAQQQKLSEAFFNALTAASKFGEQFANRALVACP